MCNLWDIYVMPPTIIHTSNSPNLASTTNTETSHTKTTVQFYFAITIRRTDCLKGTCENGEEAQEDENIQM